MIFLAKTSSDEKVSYIEIIFLPQMTDLEIYEKYCHNKPRSESLWRQCSDCAFFQVNKLSAHSTFELKCSFVRSIF